MFSYSKKLTKKQKQFIKEKCRVRAKADIFCDDPPLHSCYSVSDGAINLPLGVMKRFVKRNPNHSIPHPRTDVYFNHDKFTLLTTSTDPSGRRRDQDVVARQIMDGLNDKSCQLVAAFPGFGKTMLGVYLMCEYGYKTIVMCHLVDTLQQWVETIRDACFKPDGSPVIIQIPKGAKTRLDPDADVYVMSVQKGIRMAKKGLLDDEVREMVGMVIFDEIHIAPVSGLTKIISQLRPKYSIGLSATPDRKDGLHKLFEPFYGKGMILREEVKNSYVIKVETEFVPEIEYIVRKGIRMPDGTIKENSIAYNVERTDMAIRIFMKWFSELKTLFVCSRVAQVKMIVDRLVELGIDVTSNTKEKHRQVIVGCKGACGTGYDLPGLRALFLMTCIGDVRQVKERIRDPGGVIVDIVDDDKAYIETHWKNREKSYLKGGAKIITYKDIEHESDLYTAISMATPTKPTKTKQQKRLEKLRGPRTPVV